MLITAVTASLPGIGCAQEKLTAQQERMKSCNVEAKEQKLRGEERQDFMSQCLKGDGGQKLTSQQEKMRTCNRDASEKGLKGEKRQDFMSDCLRAESSRSRSAATGGR